MISRIRTSVDDAVRYSTTIGLIWKTCKACFGGTSVASKMDAFQARAYVVYDMKKMRNLIQASIEATIAEKKLGELDDWKPNINNVMNQLNEAHNTTKSQVLIDNNIDESELDNN